MKTYSTSEIADAARTTLRTIRFWESQGLFAQVERDRRGERQFTEAHLQRARIISAASMAGMSLDAIREASPSALVVSIGGAISFLQSVARDLPDSRGFDL